MLDPTCTAIQIVDGNNYIIKRLRTDSAGLTVRNIAADIRACQRPPVFVFDHPNGNARRRTMFSEYKVRPLKEVLQRAEDFYPTIELVYSICAFLPVVYLRVPDWEADDVIATIARHDATFEQKVRIVSSDKDLGQLCADPNITITADLNGIDPHYIRLYKTFVGDSSDKIPGVYRFGDKSWEYLNKPLVQNIIENLGDFKDYSGESLGLNPKHYEWVCEHIDDVRLYWCLVGLMTVPQNEILSNIRIGQNNPHKINEILGKFHL